MSESRDRHSRLVELFEKASALPPEDRAAFARDECGADDALRDELEALLRADLETGRELRIEVPALLTMTPERITRYRIKRVLGEGGFGVVYLAEQSDPIRREVALKVIKPGMDSRTVVARFRAERQLLALMEHPNIARVLDAGTTEHGLPFFVMDYVPGMPITDYCDRHCLGLRERLRLFMQVCAAVQHAHQKGVIHRDLKPSNILVTKTPEGPAPKVIDFGVSKATDVRAGGETILTEHGVFVGTPEYMSPEQIIAGGVSADTRADVYALGVVLFELLSGRVPFVLRGATLTDIYRVAQDVPAPRPSTLLGSSREQIAGVAERRALKPTDLIRELREELEWLPLKALAKDPDERYLSVQAMREDIGRYLDGRPLVAGPPTRWYVLRKFVGRNRAAVGASAGVAAVLVLLIIGLGIATMTATRTVRELRASRESEQYEVYCARLYALQTADRLDDVRNVIGLLEACPEQLRGWEWRYLHARTDRSLATLRGHTGTVMSLAASADGEQIVTASRDGSVRSWRGGREEWRVDVGSELFTVDLERSGARLVIGGSRGLTQIRAASDGRLLLDLAHETPNSIRGAAFSPSGDRVVTACRDGVARVWSSVTGELVVSSDGHERGLTAAGFVPDGERVITCDSGGTVREWDASTGAGLREFRGHGDSAQSVEFDASGDHLVTASLDGTARVWSMRTGEQLVECVGHTDGLWYADIAPDGSLLATGSVDRSARLWDGETGLEQVRLRGHTAQVECVQFVPSRGWVITGSRDGTARVWDTNSREFPEIIPIRGSSAAFTAFLPGGEELLIRQPGGSLAALELASGVSRGLDSAERVSELALTERDGLVGLEQAAPVDRAVFEGDPLGPTSWFGDTAAAPLVLSADGRRMLTRIDGALLVWDVLSGEELHRIQVQSGLIRCAAFGPRFGEIALGCEDGSVWLWRADQLDGPRLLGSHEGPALSVSFDRPGARVVSTSASDRVGMIWTTDADADPVVLAGHDHSVLSARFSPDGTRVVSASADKTARIWDASTGVGLLILEGHTDWVLSATFSPDGTQVLTASRDGSARVWDSIPRRERLAGSPDGGD